LSLDFLATKVDWPVILTVDPQAVKAGRRESHLTGWNLPAFCSELYPETGLYRLAYRLSSIIDEMERRRARICGEHQGCRD
jgi:hypothetical protein